MRQLSAINQTGKDSIVTISSLIADYARSGNIWWPVVLGIFIVIPMSLSILGVTLDSNHTLRPHIKAISKSCFYHIRSFRQIRPSTDRSMACCFCFGVGKAWLCEFDPFRVSIEAHISPSASTARTCQSRNAEGLSFFFIDWTSQTTPLATYWMENKI